MQTAGLPAQPEEPLQPQTVGLPELPGKPLQPQAAGLSEPSTRPSDGSWWEPPPCSLPPGSRMARQRCKAGR